MPAHPRCGTRRHRRRTAILLGAALTLAPTLAGCQSANPAVVLEEDPTLPQHSVYRPADLGTRTDRLPIVVWGESGCITNAGAFTETLSEIAAHGYLVVADLTINTAGNDSVDLLQSGLDWAVAENSRPGSIYQGRLDTGRIATMGHSCGGLEALHVGTDPRVTSVVSLDSGIFDTVKLGGATQADLPKLHTPVLWMNAGPSDIAYPQAQKNFAQVSAIPAVWANYDLAERGNGVTGAHLGTWFEPKGGEMNRAVVAWLDFTLKRDATAGTLFLGPCSLCATPKWTVQSKNF